MTDLDCPALFECVHNMCEYVGNTTYDDGYEWGEGYEYAEGYEWGEGYEFPYDCEFDVDCGPYEICELETCEVVSIPPPACGGEAPIPRILDPGAEVLGLSFVDLDADGSDELVVATQDDFLIYEPDSDVPTVTPRSNPSGQARLVGGDFDLASGEDLVVDDGSGLYLYSANGMGGFSNQATLVPGTDAYLTLSMLAGDIDDQGPDDLLVTTDEGALLIQDASDPVAVLGPPTLDAALLDHSHAIAGYAVSQGASVSRFSLADNLGSIDAVAQPLAAMSVADVGYYLAAEEQDWGWHWIRGFDVETGAYAFDAVLPEFGGFDLHAVDFDGDLHDELVVHAEPEAMYLWFDAPQGCLLELGVVPAFIDTAHLSIGDHDDDGDEEFALRLANDTVAVFGTEPILGNEDLQLTLAPVKQFEFSWPETMGATHYQLFEREEPNANFVQVGGDTAATTMSLTVPLHLRADATYRVSACDGNQCVDTQPLDVAGNLVDAVGYFKASNTDAGDRFGFHLALSADGSTLAVGADAEDSAATGIDGDQANDGASGSGAVYVFVQSGQGAWVQQAYIKASNTDSEDQFGNNVALSADGDTMVVSAPGEDSGAAGVDGNQDDNGSSIAGAAYVFTRDNLGVWSQQAYLKASNPGVTDAFGWGGVSLSDDGDTTAVGARLEDSGAVGVNGNQADNGSADAGAVYVFVRNQGVWTQQAYVKASNTGAGDNFGTATALSANGDTLVVGAHTEDSGSLGIDGDPFNNNAGDAGAAYVFVRDGLGVWTQQAYVKASNTGAGDNFGPSVALSDDGNTLAVGALLEDGGGVDSGAVYTFTRDNMNVWSEEAFIKASWNAPGSWFHLVALDGPGDVLAVGAQKGALGGVGVNPMVPGADAGAVFVYVRDEMGDWSTKSSVKPSNSEQGDHLGYAVALDGSGQILVLGTYLEDGGAIGIDGNQFDNSSPDAGAVYVY